MRNIAISTEVFSLIWAQRRPPEETENEILLRILTSMRPLSDEAAGANQLPHSEKKEGKTSDFDDERVKQSEGITRMFGKVRWVDDVRTALTKMGGEASLHSIYREVECIRREAGRSIPKTLEAVIRRTLEDHSSDSANYRGVDLFGLPEGHGKGIWALRK